MQELTPVKNIYVSQYFPDKNYGLSKDKTLFVGQFKGQGDSYRSLMHFDLTKLVERAFESVYLFMNITRNEIPAGIIQLGIYRVLKDWDEKTVTWNSLPPVVPVPELSFPVVNGWTGLITVDITRLVLLWLESTFPNHGLVLIGNELSDSLVAISNIQDKDFSNWPRLIAVE